MTLREFHKAFSFSPLPLYFSFNYSVCSGQIFSFNSHQAQLSHPWAFSQQLKDVMEAPLSSGKSNTEPRGQSSRSDPRVARIWERLLSTKEGVSVTLPECHSTQGASPSPRDTFAMFHLMSIFLLITPVLPDFFRKLKLMSPRWLHVFLSFSPISSLRKIF